jgi:predicted transcriptional regulator
LQRLRPAPPGLSFDIGQSGQKLVMPSEVLESFAEHQQLKALDQLSQVLPVHVAPETNIDECMRVMTSRLVRHLPVLQGESVVGMISMSDMVKWIISSHEQTIHQLENYIGGRYPG